MAHAVKTEPAERGFYLSREPVRSAPVTEGRRSVIGALACVLLTSRFAVLAHMPSRLIRIGWLTTVPFLGTPLHSLFSEAMRERGWIEGRHFVIESRYSGGRNELLPALAAELVRLDPDIIVSGGSPTTTAAMNATTRIPLLFFNVGDPVGSGFAASLARPGGNLTGFGGLGTVLHLKQLELLQEIEPRPTRVAMFVNPAFSFHVTTRTEIEAFARQQGVVMRPIEVRSPDDLDAAFDSVARERIDALLILGQPFYLQEAARVARLATLHRLPCVGPFEDLVKAGCLMSYAGRLTDDVKRLPSLIERIVNGTNPADIPVEQGTRFYLMVNLKTAKAIGVLIPPSLLLRVDSLIE